MGDSFHRGVPWTSRQWLETADNDLLFLPNNPPPPPSTHLYIPVAGTVGEPVVEEGSFKRFRRRDQRYSATSRALAFHAATPGLILSIPYALQAPPVVTLEHCQCDPQTKTLKAISEGRSRGKGPDLPVSSLGPLA